MRVLIVCRSFPHHRPGGMEWHAHDVAEGLMAEGVTVDVITTPLPRRPALAPLRVNGRVLELGGTPGAYDMRFLWDFARRAGRFVREVRPDVVHAQGMAGMLADPVLGRKVPVVTTVHGTLWSETVPGPGHLRRYWKRYLLAPLWKRFVRSWARLIVDSRFTARELRHETKSRVRPLAVVPLGFDLGRFPLLPRAEARSEWGIAEGVPLIAAAGRVEEAKGFGDLVAAFCERRVAGGQLSAGRGEEREARGANNEGRPAEPVLTIAGEGTLLPVLQRAAADAVREGRIRFAGRVPAERLASLLRAADLFVNLDRGAPAFGLANAEALCMGTPVLTTDAGAHREVVRSGEDGTLVPRGSPHAVAEALGGWLARLPEPDAVREERARAARERFSRERMVRRLMSAYGR